MTDLVELPEFESQSPMGRQILDVLIDIADLQTQLVAEVKHLRNAVASTARSSAELAENAKGGIQITTKAYADSPIDSACIEAVAGFRTLKQEIEIGMMNQWRDTLESLRDER